MRPLGGGCTPCTGGWRHVALAWAATFPAAAVVGAAASWVAKQGTAGVVVVAGGGSALAAGIWFASRRNPVSALNVNDVPVPVSSDRARAAALRVALTKAASR